MNDNNDNNSRGEAPQYTSFNETTTDGPVLLAPTPDNMQLYLKKLDLLYQSLEGRVQKLETIVTEKYLNLGDGNPSTSPQSFNVLPVDNVYSMAEYSLAGNGPSTLNSSNSSSLTSLLETTQREISVIRCLAIVY